MDKVMEKRLEVLSNRFASWSNLVSATAALEKQKERVEYDCNWCNSGCGGCAGCGDNTSPVDIEGKPFLPGSQISTPSYMPELRTVEAKASYECQGCDGCNGCNSCE